MMKIIKTPVPWNRFDNTEAEFYALLEKYDKQLKTSKNPQEIADLISILDFLVMGTLDDLKEDEVEWSYNASEKTWKLYKSAVKKLFELNSMSEQFSVAQRDVEPLMKKYGYIDGNGWWIKTEEPGLDEIPVLSIF